MWGRIDIPPPIDGSVVSGTEHALEDAPVYEFPKRMARRKRISYVALPALFYGSLLVGLAVAGPSVWGNARLVLYMSLFLTGVMGFFMLLVHSSRPWLLVFGDRGRVGGREFAIKDLGTVIVYVDRRMMFERPPYQLIFLVDDPVEGPTRIISEAMRNVQDVDTAVRDLRRLLPGVEFVDRTLSGGSALDRKMVASMGDGGDRLRPGQHR